MVVDLSAANGEDAMYPVSYLDAMPEGGWTDEYKTTKLVLRRIEAGTFTMGNDTDSANPPHQVTLTKPYYIGVFEVTQKQYELVTGSNPAENKGDKLPIVQVSWNTIRGNSSTYNWPSTTTVDANSFMGRFQTRTGRAFDLPTDAQWEYACRAGTTTTYSYGDTVDGNYMWYGENSSNTTHEVGTKLPNGWGLYDMHGNVWDWCLDWYGNLSGSATDPVGPSSGTYRVGHGGSLCRSAEDGTSSYRFNFRRYDEYYDLGFRLACPCEL